MKNIFLAILIITAIAGSSFAAERPSYKHEVFFEGTNFELHVFRINGRVDGKTMLIVGGIQGDEPGGFLSADLYSDMALETGNLIVVPRANLQSVILFNRGVEGDMNRLFADDKAEDTQGEVVLKIKELMAESDIFLNLHDGWGFHRPTYISKAKNPNRFGQSIIIDGEAFRCEDNTTIPLGDMARSVLGIVNSKIEDPELHLHLFDTKTEDKESKFKDMRKTATWYAITSNCIPAFGIEGSKNAKSLEQNVLYHNYAINEFMKMMNIIPEQPRVLMIEPQMEMAVVNVNDVSRQIISGDTLYIDKGDTVQVSYIESNYLRGLTCDILGHGTLNDTGETFKINNDTKIVFRKDNVKMSEINIKVSKPAPKKTDHSVWVFLMKIDGKYSTATDGETVRVKNGSTLELIKLFSDSVSDSDYILNFKGWFPEGSSNDGDDRGYEIKFPSHKMMPKYAVPGNARLFPVIAGDERSPAATMYIEID